MRAAALVLLLASCSWLTVQPPAAPPQPPGDCTTSQAAPRVDRAAMVAGIAGSLLGSVLLLAASNCSPNSDTCTAETAYGVILFVPSAIVTVAYGLSAHDGYARTDACRARRSAAATTALP